MQIATTLRALLVLLALLMSGGVMHSSVAQSIEKPQLSANTASAAVINIVGDGIDTPLTTTPGDAARGAAIVANRQIGLCVLCHQIPGTNEKFQSNIAASIAATGSRWSASQLRLRLVDSRRLDPTSIMPAYHRVDSLTRVANAYQGRPILDAQQIEDVVAYLVTLK